MKAPKCRLCGGNLTRDGCWFPAGVHIPGHAGSIPVLASKKRTS